MSRILSVTLGGQLPSPAHFNPTTIPPANTPSEMAIFFEENKDEIAFARSVLQHAPLGTKLSCHFGDRALIYHNLSNNQSHALQHTYIVIQEGILAVQTERGDINIIGVGHYGEVKRVYPLPNPTNAQPAPHAVAMKKFRPSTSSSEEIPDEITARLGKADKPKNPLKSAQGEVGVIEKPLWPGSDIHLRFNADDFDITNKKPVKIKPSNPILANTRKRIQEPSTTAKLETAPAWTMDLATFIERNRGKQSPHVVLKIIASFLKAVEAMHKKGWLHRDIKPNNILVDPDRQSVGLTDFDFAIDIPLGADHVVGEYCGTQAFLPYEATGKPLDTTPPLFWDEIPQKYKIVNNQIAYRTSSEMPAIGLTIRYLRHTLPDKDEIGPTIKSLGLLMGCYHPEGRPSLMLMRLAFFSLQWNAQQQAQGLTKTDPVALSAALAQENLPNLSAESIGAITDILTLASEIFQIEQAHSLDSHKAKQHFSNTTPKHEPNQWGFLFAINTKLEKLIHNPNKDALMSLRGMLTLCKNHYAKDKTIANTLNLLSWIEVNSAYKPFLPALHTASSKEHAFFLVSLNLSDELFSDHPDKDALIPHTMHLLRRIVVPAEQVDRLLKDAASTPPLRDLIIQHWTESREPVNPQGVSIPYSRLFQAAPSQRKIMQFTVEIEAALKSPFSIVESPARKLEALHAKIKESTVTPDIDIAPPTKMPTI